MALSDPLNPAMAAELYRSRRRLYQVRAHDYTNAELLAHPAPEPCSCPGHELFRAIADRAAADAHAALRPDRTCPTCGWRAGL